MNKPIFQEKMFLDSSFALKNPPQKINLKKIFSEKVLKGASKTHTFKHSDIAIVCMGNIVCNQCQCTMSLER